MSLCTFDIDRYQLVIDVKMSSSELSINFNFNIIVQQIYPLLYVQLY